MPGVGAHDWVAGIAAVGAILSRGTSWLAGLQWKPLDISQVLNLHLVNAVVNGQKKK